MDCTVEAGESVSATLPCAVAEVDECCPTELPPLRDTLAVAALDASFSPETDEPSQFEGSLVFEYSDSFVSIWSDRSRFPRDAATGSKRGVSTLSGSGTLSEFTDQF
jgi:hypothetical protein